MHMRRETGMPGSGTDPFPANGGNRLAPDAAHAYPARFFRQRPAHESISWANETAIIWHPSEVETHYEQPRNAFCRFRRTFELNRAPRQATIRLFADSRYRLFVNGHYVGRGPGRSDPRWQYYDTWDIGPLLGAGANTLAVLALHYGYGTGQSMHRIPAFLAQCDWTEDDGSIRAIGTDASWKTSPHPAYDRSAPRINGCQGPMEIVDARLEDGDWTHPDYDDSRWEQAKARNRQLSPFWNLVPREIALLEEGAVAARAIVNRGEAAECPHPAHALHKQLLAEEEHIVILEHGDWPTEGYRIGRTEAGKAAVVTADFGRLEVGYLQLEASGSGGDVLDVVYAEELWQGKALLNANNNRSADRFILKDGLNRFEIAFGYKACRYVQLRVRNPRADVRLQRIGLRTRYYPVEQPSDFSCSDERLNRLWSLSAHTLRCCMQDGFLDSPSREQQQWMGDGRMQAAFNSYYSGDSRLYRKLLRQFGQSQDWLGMIASRYPDDHHNYPPIPSFCLQWVCAFGDYARYTGDTGLEAEAWPNVVQALRWFTAYLNDDGLLEQVPYWSFVDWGELPKGPAPDVGRGGVVAALNLQYLESLRVAIGMAGRLGDEEAARVFRSLADRLEQGIVRRLWDEEKGVYPDCLVGGQLSPRCSEATNSLALLHLHLAGDPRARRIVAALLAEERRVVRASPYFMLPVLRALDLHGAGDAAMAMMRERYGAMLDAGATTLWENWDLFYETAAGEIKFNSASHAWAAAPLAALPELVLGLRPVDNGFARVEIRPCLFDLTRAQGRISTPAGRYAISVARAGDGCRLELTVPAGCAAEVGGREYGAGRHELVLDLESEPEAGAGAGLDRKKPAGPTANRL